MQILQFIKSLFSKTIRLITNVLQVLKTNFPITISLAALYLIFGVADQGQDMLININSSDLGPFTLYFMLTVLALIHWQFPKFFSKEALGFKKFSEIFKADFYSTTKMEDYNRIVPRLLGVTTFLVPAYCILELLPKYKVEQNNDWWHQHQPIIFLVCSLFAFGLLLHNNWLVKFYKWLCAKNGGKVIYATICILLAVSPLIFLLFNFSLPSNQVYLFWGWFCYALLFAMVTSTRWSIVRDYPIKPVKFLLQDKTLTSIVWTLSFFCSAIFLFFLVTNFSGIVFQNTYNLTFAIALCGFVFYLTIVTLILYLGKRAQRNYLAVTFIALFLLAQLNPDFYHQVKTQKPGTGTPTETLRSYMETWIKNRKAGLKEGERYPIILVNTYGGGIRAAAWTCVLINHLDSLTNGEFQKHVFAYSGASGGTIGASIACANGFNDPFNKLNYFQKDSIYHQFFTGNDFLTADLVGLLGNDMLYSAIPFNKFRDRSVLQATCWEDAYKKCFFNQDLYRSDFFDLWNNASANNKYNVPLLFSNSSEVTEGRKGIIAPVGLEDSDFIGDVLIKNLFGPDTSIKLSTAAFLSARFPYVSPAGEIISTKQKRKHSYYFIDGGAKENSGAETSNSIANLVKKVFNSSTSSIKGLDSSFPIIIISFKNTNIVDKIIEEQKKVNQLIAPVNTIINGGINGATVKADSINRSGYKYYFLLYPHSEKILWKGENLFCRSDTESTRCILPLGWQLSNLAMSFLDSSIAYYPKESKKEKTINDFIKTFDSLKVKK